MERESGQVLIVWWLIAVVISAGLWGLDVLGRMRWFHGGADFIFNPAKVELWKVKSTIYKQFEFLVHWEEGQQELWFLRRQTGDITKLQGEIEQLKQENESLRRLLGAPLGSNWKFLPGKVIGYDAHGWRINRGTRHGVALGMPVLADNLLVGKVSVAEELHSYVQAVDSVDANWEVEVRRNESGELAGNGLLRHKDGVLYVERILPNETVTANDLVITRGVEGILPGIPVGKLSAIETPEDSAVYQRARVWWPVSRELVQDVVVIYEW